jgi:hypothetical protein
MSKRAWVIAIATLSLILLAATGLLPQEVVKTKDGRLVLLKPDGTWVYLKEDAPHGAAPSPVPSATQTNPAEPAAQSVLSRAATTTCTSDPNSQKQQLTDEAQNKNGVETGQKTASGQTIYEGPRGGHYHYSASGKKVYERHKK